MGSYLQTTKIQSLVCWELYDEAYVLVQERAQWLALMSAIDVEYKTAYYVFTTIAVVEISKKETIEKEDITPIIQEAIDEILPLYEANPDLIGTMYYIILGQKAEFDNEVLDAMNHYDTAIEYAIKGDLLLYVALANELATKFYLSINKNDFAELYLKQAVNYYQLWGSDTKAEALENEYRHIYRRTVQNYDAGRTTLRTMMQIQHHQGTGSTGGSSMLDIDTLMKASQALSKEIHLERLVQRMLQILIENAGADKGVLFLEQNNQLFLQGEIYADGDEKILQNIPLSETKNIASSNVINYVNNSKTNLRIDDASQDTRFSETAYIQNSAVKSLACLPIINQNKLVGLLYLENSLVEGAFSEDRINYFLLWLRKSPFQLKTPCFMKIWSRSRRTNRSASRKK